MVLGDFNARVGKTYSITEKRHIGKYTFDAKNFKKNKNESTLLIRTLFLNLCKSADLKATNTFYAKSPEKLATYRTPEARKDLMAPFTRPYFEQLDYILIQDRWKNSILETEADMWANLSSDHRPVICKFRFKLKYQHKNKTIRRNSCPRGVWSVFKNLSTMYPST